MSKQSNTGFRLILLPIALKLFFQSFHIAHIFFNKAALEKWITFETFYKIFFWKIKYLNDRLYPALGH